jgi:hypothetical protein
MSFHGLQPLISSEVIYITAREAPFNIVNKPFWSLLVLYEYVLDFEAWFVQIKLISQDGIENWKTQKIPQKNSE